MHADTKTFGALFARARARIRITYVLLALVAAAGIFFAVEDVSRHLSAIEAWVAGLGPLGVILFILLYVVLTSSLFPESLLTVAAGTLFTLGTGTVVVVVGGLCAAAAQYLLARKLLTSFIERRLAAKPTLAAVRDAVLHDQVRMQLLLRVTPLNATLLNYILGASGVRFRGFLLASPAMLPVMMMELYLGYAGKHLAHTAGKSSSHIGPQDAVLVIGLAVTVVVVMSVSWRAQKIVAAGGAR